MPVVIGFLFAVFMFAIAVYRPGGSMQKRIKRRRMEEIRRASREQ